MVHILPANHWLFHLANSFLLLSYGVFDILILRVVLAIGCLCFALWGALVLAPPKVSLDTLLWNLVFFVLNVVQAVRILYLRRPVKFKERIHETIYEKLFKTVGISRIDFKLLISAAHVRVIKANSVYIEQGNDTHSLTLLQSGQTLSTTKDHDKEVVVNEVNAFEFIDSPEWCGRIRQNSEQITKKKLRKERNKGSNIESGMIEMIPTLGHVDVDESATVMHVTVRSTTECTFLSWPVESLMNLFRKHPQLAGPVSSVVANDIATKLFRQTGTKVFRKQLLKRLSPEGEEEQLQEPSEFSSNDNDLKEFLKVKLNKEILPSDIHKLCNIAKWRTYRKEGTPIFRNGEIVYQLGVIVAGGLDVFKGDSEDFYQLEVHDMFGTSDFMSRDHLAETTVQTRGPCKILIWEVEDLRNLMESSSEISQIINSLVAIDLAARYQSLIRQ